MRTQLDSLGNSGQRFAPHEMSMPAGKIALGLGFKPPPQKVGDDQTEDPVAEEFEALVAAFEELAMLPAALGNERAGMGQGLSKQLATGELVTDDFRQILRGHVNSHRETGGYSGSQTAISIAPRSASTRRSRKR